MVTNTTDSERGGLALNNSSTQFALDSAQFGVNHGGDRIEGRSRSLRFGFYHHIYPHRHHNPGPVMDTRVGHGSGLG